MKFNPASIIDDLTPDQKVDLLEALWVSLESQAIAPTEEQEAEMDRRMARYPTGPVKCCSMGNR